MRRPRKFLTLILILLVINTVFFISWYAFNVQGRVKGIIEREAGKALKGEFQIRDFSISDQQIFAEGITYAAADSSFGFRIDSARARFNLLKFIFSGFRLNNILDHTEIVQGEVTVLVIPKPGPKKPRKKLEIPDLTRIFNNLKVTDSRFRIEVNTPVEIIEPGMLRVREELEQVNISILNAKVSNITLTAVTANKGTLHATGILDNGYLRGGRVEISNYIPLFASHPQVLDLSSEVNLVADVFQKEKYADLELNGKAILWNTKALLFSQYPLHIPLLTAESDGDKLAADLAQSSLGTSFVGGRLSLSGLQRKIVFDPSELDLELDLAMLDPQLRGMVAAKLQARGSIDDPVLRLAASSDEISYGPQSARNLELAASYEDEILSFAMDDAIWENQSIRVSGTYFTPAGTISAFLDIAPVSLAVEELKINAAMEIDLAFYEKLPEVKARILNLSVAQGKLNLESVSGHADLFPGRQGEVLNYYVDLELDSPDGTHLSLIGDILDRSLLLEADFNTLALMDIYPLESLRPYDPVIKGRISSFLSGNKAVLSTQLDLVLNGSLDLSAGLDLIASYDLDSHKGMAILESSEATLNGVPLDLELIAELQEQILTLHTLRLNDKLFLSGYADLGNLGDLRGLAFDLNLRDLDIETVAAYFPELALPEIAGVKLNAHYNREGSRVINAELEIEEFKIPGLRTLSGVLNLNGYPEQVEISGGINNQYRRLIDLTGTVSLEDNPDLRLQAITNGLGTGDLMYSALADGAIDAVLGFYVENAFSPEMDISFDARVSSPHISIPDVVDLDDILIRVSQTKTLLVVDTLSVRAPQFGSVKGSGAIDYNLANNTFYDGNSVLDLEIEGDFFDWLTENVEMITAARGKADLNCGISTFEGQFIMKSGALDIKDARIYLKDQPEPIRDLNISASILDNDVSIENFTCFIGDGKLTIKNEFDDDPDSHLSVGFLDLGSLALRIEQPGATVNI
ncbi:MAG: hypothetical protein K0B87_08855, partial [Candidatus Syntrophosphaera sp.]|nr:hypothetical protein [Candidatus Syntrophosphaera sp.]